MKSKVMAVGLSALMATSSYAGWEIKEARCGSWGDSLNDSQAHQRWAWAKKCDPVLKQIMTISPNMIPNEMATDSHGRRRRTYPVYGQVDANDNPSNPLSYLAPADANAGCNLPSGYTVAFLCYAGCFTPDQAISFTHGDEEIAQAEKLNLKNLVTFKLDENAAPVELEHGVKKYISSAISGTHKILEITTESGKTLKVTEEHPLVMGDARVVAADFLKVGDSLLGEDGQEAITEIKKAEFEGKVHNIEVDTDNPGEKLFLADGLYSADVTFQNENDVLLGQMINRLTLVSDEDVK